jgi:hypothetical protein
MTNSIKMVFGWIGEFQKLCPEGIGRGDSGQDLDECAVMLDVCEGGECINTDGSFRCECPQGYILDSSGEKCIGRLVRSFSSPNKSLRVSP